jgi:hypothetical protein
VPLSSLLAYPEDERAQDAFALDHAMAHRAYYQVMAPLHQWSVLPYFVEPVQHADVLGSQWHMNHQQAHDDFTRTLPSDFGTTQVGIPVSQILLESDLSDPGSRAWWTFANHQEHYIANGAVLPSIPDATTDPAGQVLPPPWINPARWIVPPFW